MVEAKNSFDDAAALLRTSGMEGVLQRLQNDKWKKVLILKFIVSSAQNLDNS